MGYASYFEDIRDRIRDDLMEPTRAWIDEQRAGLERRADVADELRSAIGRLEAFLDVCAQLEADLANKLALATDPHIDLVHENSELRKSNDQLKMKVDALGKKIVQANRELIQLRGEHARDQEELKRLQDAMMSDRQTKSLLIRDEQTRHKRPRRGGLD